jgi:type II secretory pathway pseudopilin PulG
MEPMSRDRRRARDGFTLIQCIMAMAAMATLSVVLMDLLGRSGDLTRLSAETDLATALAQSQLEALRALDAGEIELGDDQPVVIGHDAVAVLPFGEAAIDVAREGEGLVRARSRVSWGPKSRRRTVRLETFIAVPGVDDEG